MDKERYLPLGSGSDGLKAWLFPKFFHKNKTLLEYLDFFYHVLGLFSYTFFKILRWMDILHTDISRINYLSNIMRDSHDLATSHTLSHLIHLRGV